MATEMKAIFTVFVKKWKCDGGMKMLQFTNGFTCARDQEKEELIITFVQHVPELDGDGNVTNVKVEEVVKLVMGKVTAQNLADGLAEVLTDDNDV
ncbi:MAG: hypothetical protein NC305_03335 [Lachnospiraceae bacterium]|nr:hypothetical protein [Butyrivibrio sp.]MCM1343212.1 hypothetical protein [Muribaculaceae bacterium]MCM1409563.1 hypothetical protein [Lachnospiraceae bacterium]